MKAKENRGSTKGKAGKRAVKDLPAKSAASVKGWRLRPRSALLQGGLRYQSAAAAAAATATAAPH